MHHTLSLSAAYFVCFCFENWLHKITAGMSDQLLILFLVFADLNWKNTRNYQLMQTLTMWASFGWKQFGGLQLAEICWYNVGPKMVGQFKVKDVSSSSFRSLTFAVTQQLRVCTLSVLSQQHVHSTGNKEGKLQHPYSPRSKLNAISDV